ncbi:hypothetical protein [Bradyrhizobium sp. cf659]|uniref:hypothetical protein n=1 Tax=Bradyrhizobium sp. cf659 TaxID=1761771 RepID=UPI0015A68265|nr:hypothetical protein [Bradyrhizobium sp. cf659]
MAMEDRETFSLIASESIQPGSRHARNRPGRGGVLLRLFADGMLEALRDPYVVKAEITCQGRRRPS